MKRMIGASLCLAVLCCVSPAMADTDPSAEASNLAGCAALSAVAAPVMLGAAAVTGTSAAAEGLVKIVDGTGKGLSDLTEASLETVDTASEVISDPSEVQVTVNKKQIPLVVRKDYLELNEKVQTK
jgi:hypothetical protein